MKCSNPDCGADNDPVSKFCQQCGNPLLSTVRGGSGRREGTRASGKNPITASVLSLLLPGIAIGQFYNGDVKKGVVMVLGTIILPWFTWGSAAVGIWIWSVIDAYNVAAGKWTLW
jgi:TM2 domain-containing membrane protein YozV